MENITTTTTTPHHTHACVHKEAFDVACRKENGKKQRMRQKSPWGKLQYATTLASIVDMKVGGSRVQSIGTKSHQIDSLAFMYTPFCSEVLADHKANPTMVGESQKLPLR